MSVISNGNFYGLSGETKPTTYVMVGALFVEIDTHQVYHFDGSAWLLYAPITAPEGTDIVLVVRPSDATARNMTLGDLLATASVNNAAAANTLGSVVKKTEVFDAAGESLGFIPIYDAITVA